MAEDQKVSLFRWVQFVVGCIIAAGLFYIHAYVKDLPALVLAAPFLLMGVKPSMFLNGRDGK
jgi:hypothetical protein